MGEGERVGGGGGVGRRGRAVVGGGERVGGQGCGEGTREGGGGKEGRRGGRWGDAE